MIGPPKVPACLLGIGFEQSCSVRLGSWLIKQAALLMVYYEDLY
jgi:hypothetical protein